MFAARVGQPVDVKNSDPIGHNTNISGSSFNQLIPSGDSTVFTPGRETGLPVSVTCNIHPWMKAYAVFREDGYVAVSSGDGTFEIPDLPAGEHLSFKSGMNEQPAAVVRWILISQNCNGIQRDVLK